MEKRYVLSWEWKTPGRKKQADSSAAIKSVMTKEHCGTYRAQRLVLGNFRQKCQNMFFFYFQLFVYNSTGCGYNSDATPKI